MENITAKIEKKTRKVYLSKSVIGNDGENLQEKLVFSFDSFVNGTARLELNRNNTQSYIMLTKVDNTYELPIRSLITKVGKLDLQLVITEGTNENEIPVFKSNTFFVIVNSSINAEIEEDEEYPQWIDVANTKLNELDAAISEASNLNITANKSGSTTTITLTDKEGDASTVSILDGATGAAGQDGSNGITPTIGDNGNWYLGEIDTGKPSRGIQGETGSPGAAGQDGISPIANITKSGNTATITIIDKSGTTTATVSDGVNGVDGQPGRDGYVQYTAGENITIENDVISATGGGINIEWMTVSTSNPYILSEMKTGIYYTLGAGAYKDTSSSSTYSYIYTQDYGNYCYPEIIILNKDVSEATANEEFGYVVFKTPEKLITGKYLKSGDIWIAPIVKFGNTFRIKTYSYGIWLDIGQVLNELPQSIKGVKTFYSIPQVSSYSVPTQDTQLVPKKYVDDKIGDINTILATLTTPGGNS